MATRRIKRNNVINLVMSYTLLFIMFLFNACSTSDDVLVLGLIAPSTDHLPVGLALQENILDKNDLKIHYFSSGWEVNEAIIAGRIDVAIMPFTYAWKGVSEGKDIRIISFFERESDGIIASSDIQSVEQLNGRRVGVLRASTLDIFVHKIAEKYNFKPHLIYFRTPTEMASALMSGAVDALSYYVPQIHRLESDKFRVIYWFSEDYLHHPCCDLIATGSAIKNKKNQLEKFMEGLRVSCDYLENNPEKGIELMMENYNLNRREAELTLENTAFIMSLDETGKEFQRKTAEKMKQLEYLRRIPTDNQIYYYGLQE